MDLGRRRCKPLDPQEAPGGAATLQPTPHEEEEQEDEDALLAITIVRPKAYDVHLALAGPPHLAMEGSVDITLEVYYPTASIRLHANTLRIFSAALVHAHGLQAATVRYVSPQIIAVDVASGSLARGVHVLRLTFAGPIALQRSEGIYACQWSPRRCDHTAAAASKSESNDEEDSHMVRCSWILATHFEPEHARRAFPCFDQCIFKARVRFTLLVPGRDRQRCVMSNTQEAFSGDAHDFSAHDLGESGAAFVARILQQSAQLQNHHHHDQRQHQDLPPLPSTWHLTRFEQTPPMSTYVLGFWVGHFQALHSHPSSGPPTTNSVRVTVHLPPHRNLEDGRFALDCAHRSVAFFAQLFQCPYPLPKMDILCLPQMHGVGMEGFAAITLLEDYLLVSPTTDFVRRRRITRLLAHEVIHQWIGNLVTPTSFDELWLKEAGARLFEYIAMVEMYPKWHMWENFVSEIILSSMLADANPLTSHPVVQHHHGNLRSIVESFDVIVYGKGAAILRMLAEHLGMDVFLAGIRRFLARFQYNNASHTDLWAALDEEVDSRGAKNEKGPCVSELMEPWLVRPGYPALHVHAIQTSDHVLRLCFSQRPFSLLSGGTEAVKDPLCHSKPRFIPLRVRIGSAAQSGVQTHTLLVGECTAGEVVLELPQRQGAGEAHHKAWAVVNDRHAGYFLTVYDGLEAWQLVCAALEGEYMSEEERMGLVCDLMLSVQAAMRGGGGYRPHYELNFLLGRLADVVKLLKRVHIHSPAYCNGQAFLYDIQLLTLMREIEDMEEAGMVLVQYGRDDWTEEATTPAEQTRLIQARLQEMLEEVNEHCEWTEAEIERGQEPLVEFLHKYRMLRGKIYKLKSRLQMAMAMQQQQQQEAQQHHQQQQQQQQQHQQHQQQRQQSEVKVIKVVPPSSFPSAASSSSSSHRHVHVS